MVRSYERKSKNRSYRSPDISVTKLIAIVVGLIPAIRMCLMLTPWYPNKRQHQGIGASFGLIIFEVNSN